MAFQQHELWSDPRVTTTPLEGGTWYHLESLDLEADGPSVGAIVKDETLLRGLTEWHPRPFYFQKGAELVAILKAPNLNEGGHIEDMIALRLYTDGQNIFSASIAPLISVAECQRAAQQTSLSAQKVITRLAQTITTKLRHSVSEMLDELDRLEDAVIDPSVNVPMEDLLVFRRKVIGFKRSSAPQSALLLELSEDADTCFSDACRDSFRQTSNSNTRIDEILDAMRQRAESVTQLLEAESRRSVERITYLLTLAAGVFLPLNLIAGMFGANVGGVPLADTSNGFLYMTMLLLAVAAGSLAVSLAVLFWRNRKK